MAVNVSSHSVLAMHPLSRRPEGDGEVLIGRVDSAPFIIVPELAVTIIDLLDSGLTVAQVAERVAELSGEDDIDVLGFAQDLVGEYRFVHAIDDMILEEYAAPAKPMLPWLSERVGRIVFHPLMTFPYLIALFLGAGALVIGGLDYFPRYGDLFVSPAASWSLLSALAASLSLTFLHECMHLLAARSLGIAAAVRLSHRLVFPVAETDMSGIVLLPPRRRYIAYAAGMLGDSFLLSIGFLLRLMTDTGLFDLPDSALAVIKLCNVLLLYALAFQFMFFMNTDVYYMWTTLVRCHRLLDLTRALLAGVYRRRSDRERALWEEAEGRERRLARGFAWFYAAGFVWSVVFFIEYAYRQGAWLLRIVAGNLKQAPTLSWQFADGMLSAALILLPFAWLALSWRHSLVRRRKTTQTASCDRV